MFGLGIGEVVVILFVALIFIGPKKLPELAKGLGKGIREFQNAANGLKHTIQNPVQTNNEQNISPAPLDQPDLPSDPSHDRRIEDKSVASTGEFTSDTKES